MRSSLMSCLVVVLALFSFLDSAQADVFSNVPEAADYSLVYTLPIGNTAGYNTNAIPYSVDNSATTTFLFDRIAYYLELDSGSGLQYAYASMDAFTLDAGQIGVPSRGPNGSFSSAAGKFQQAVSNMNVVSNVPSIITGTDIATGNIEFWSTNYAATASGTVPGGTTSYDFDDTKSSGADYGSMQIHNYGASQTIMAYNRWGSGTGELGIGNRATGNPDWTFANNASSYSVKNLQVLVHEADAMIVLSNPSGRAVYQRNEFNRAQVPLLGMFAGDLTRIEARAVPMAGYAGTDTGWHVIDDTLAGSDFSGSLETAAGWYQIEVRGYDGSDLVTETTIERVGIGEVFITAGQSNSANHGSVQLTPTDDRVSAWSSGNWQLAVDPQPIATGSGGSPWPALGDLLAEEYDVPIGFASVGWGGTRVDQWLPGGTLYPRLEEALDYFGPDGFRAVLWHQGESDAGAGTSLADYADRLMQIIAQSRLDAGWDVPWGVALASYRPGVGGDPDIVGGQQWVIDNDPLAFLGALTDDMIIPYRDGSGFTGIHFNEAGLQEHGRRWFDQLGAQFQLAVPEPSTFLLAAVGMIALIRFGRRKKN